MAINAPPSACVRQSGERRAHSSVSEPHARSAHDPPMPLRPARESQPRIHRLASSVVSHAEDAFPNQSSFPLASSSGPHPSNHGPKESAVLQPSHGALQQCELSAVAPAALRPAGKSLGYGAAQTPFFQRFRPCGDSAQIGYIFSPCCKPRYQSAPAELPQRDANLVSMALPACQHSSPS